MLAVPAVDLESASAEDRVRWAVESFGEGLVLTTSFGVQSAVMLHLVTRITPGIPVIFIDTGYLFPETYRFSSDLTARLKLNLKTFVPAATAAQQEALYGKQGESGLEGLKAYNFVNRVEPMDRAVRELRTTAWLAGFRRSQGFTRAFLPVVQPQNKLVKIHPILDWRQPSRPQLPDGAQPALSSPLGAWLCLGRRLAQHLQARSRHAGGRNPLWRTEAGVWSARTLRPRGFLDLGSSHFGY
jgi:phosphoadenylyl-sulfate reductase (thioredoxin)